MTDPLASEDLPVTALKGVGERVGALLAKLGIHTVTDLLFHLPLRYEDRSVITPLAQLRTGVHAQVEGRVELTEVVGKGRKALVCRIGDGTGLLHLRFFHFTAAQASRLTKGTRVRCYGEPREGYFGLEMIHPDWQVLAEGEHLPLGESLTPVYPLTEGLHQKVLRRLIECALASCLNTAPHRGLIDWLPAKLLASLHYPPLADALCQLHRPPVRATLSELKKAQQRLAFEELLAHHLSLSRLRARIRRHRAPALRLPEREATLFRESLPFPLTTAQSRVIAEILTDLAEEKPMMRLVQGDVGSGKTVVAAHAALAALASGHQVAVMAPTELLAEQHMRNFTLWLSPLGIRVTFLAGKHKGTIRRGVLDEIGSGRAGLIIGTHALFQDEVAFARLGLVIIDEQHRFGVHQRLALREKGMRGGRYPHQLIMTATPIPRTLAMLGYADLDVSIIDELPPGRTPVKTTVIPASRRPEVIARIAEWVRHGRQVYWVCTLIEESELLQCEAAEQTARMLAQALPEVRVALVHGRLKSSEKDGLMTAFKQGQIDLLVATTVIEVGVDVPNASLMVIENPERLGLAQLHQLRGRVGRGFGESHCVLMYQAPLSAAARERLGILRATHDGFVIAERDLELRGPGELLGVRQTGQVQFRVADLTRDVELLDRVKHAAEILLQEYPDHVDPLINRWLAQAGRYVEV